MPNRNPEQPFTTRYRGSRIFIVIAQIVGWFLALFGIAAGLGTGSVGVVILSAFGGMLNHGMMAAFLAVFDIADDIRRQAEGVDSGRADVPTQARPLHRYGPAAKVELEGRESPPLTGAPRQSDQEGVTP